MRFFHTGGPPRHHYRWKREWAKPKQKQKPKTQRVKYVKSHPMIQRGHLTLVWVNPNHLHFG